jgi:hypothetical protein
MRRLIAAGILLICVIVVNCFSTRQIVSTCSQANALTEQAQEEKSGDRDPYNTLFSLHELWQKESTYLALFVNHEWINQAQIEIDALWYGSSSLQKESFTEHVNTLKILLSQIEENAKFNTKSIS